MKHYANNAKWLLRLAPFRGLSFSAAYLMPFFMERGFNQTEIFGLQSVFSLAVVALEMPSGLFADKFGRAFSIKLSAPIAAIAMIAYGFSNEFWQFVVCEILLAVANALISGADSALLYDSLKAEGREAENERISKRINARLFMASALGFPGALVLVSKFGVGSTIVADGLLIAVGCYFAWKLVEAPIFKRQKKEESPLRALKNASKDVHIRWLLVLTVALNAATYMGVWMSALSYESVGIPVAWFAAVLAVRSFGKALVSHFYHTDRRPYAHMVAYVLLVGIGFAGMASGQWWLLPLMFGHDIVHAMQGPAITQRINDRIAHGHHRATLNSGVNVLQRLVFAVIGPVVGLVTDLAGLVAGLLTVAILCSGVAFVALARLRYLKTF